MISKYAQCSQGPGYTWHLLKITWCKVSLESAILENMKIAIGKTFMMCTMLRCAHFQSGPNTKILSFKFVWIYTFTSVYVSGQKLGGW